MTDYGITDHALVRYAERVLGTDMDPLRAHIAAIVARGRATGASHVVVGGFRYVLGQGGEVVTVCPEVKKYSRRTGRRQKPRRGAIERLK